jgi:hypothetical protein
MYVAYVRSALVLPSNLKTLKIDMTHVIAPPKFQIACPAHLERFSLSCDSIDDLDVKLNATLGSWELFSAESMQVVPVCYGLRNFAYRSCTFGRIRFLWQSLQCLELTTIHSDQLMTLAPLPDLKTLHIADMYSPSNFHFMDFLHKFPRLENCIIEMARTFSRDEGISIDKTLGVHPSLKKITVNGVAFFPKSRQVLFSES